ncbi:MAG: hypothetical protein IT536_09315 [Hyphomicrobiales bacterium]|nr:hypothetical protein [Hyphomicrobiales bacterium]
MEPATDPPPPAFGLLLAAHGSRGKAASNSNFEALADALRRRNIAAGLQVGYLKGEPSIAAAVRRLTPRDILVYPLLLSDGYFARVRLAQALETSELAAAGRRATVLPPLGLDPGLVELVADRAATASSDGGFPSQRTTLALVAHGSTRDSASNDATRLLATRLTASGRFARVIASFLEEPPSLAQVLATDAGPVVVVGLFVSDGLHGGEDVGRLIRGLRRSDIAFAGNVGEWPELVDVIADRVVRAGQERTRAAALADDRRSARRAGRLAGREPRRSAL